MPLPPEQSPWIAQAIRATQDDLFRRPILAERQAQLFAGSLLARLDKEQHDHDCFALDLWIGEIASLAPLTDYKHVISVVWAALLVNANQAPLEEVAILLKRRDRLLATIESVTPRVGAAASEARISAVQAMRSMLEIYAPMHIAHVEEVGRTCVALANELGLSADFTELLWASGVVHDIGMVMVPQTIIEKPGRLSSEEYESVKRHVSFGISILRSVGSLRECAPIVAAHHEHYDGSGYPEGRAGQHIPFGARVLAVADAVRAMLSARPYRAALPIETVRDILREDRGAFWDPDLANLAVELIDGGEIHAADSKQRVA